MKKSVKIILAAVMALAMCAVSFYFGMRYEKREYDLQKENEYADAMRCELEHLSELLSEESFDKNDIEAILSSLRDVRTLAESAAEYTDNVDIIRQSKDFAVALNVLYEMMGKGAVSNGALICYGFTHYSNIKSGEYEFLQALNNDVIFVLNEFDGSLLSLSNFASKYSPENILDTLSCFELDKGEHIEQLLRDRERIIKDFPNEYIKGTIINLPDLTVFSLSGEAEVHRGTSWWSNSGSFLHADSMAPIDILGKYRPELYLYEDDIFRLSFNVEPLSYTVSELTESGIEIKTDLELHKYIVMPNDRDIAKYVVRAEWAQGKAVYTFQIGLKEPADWSEYEKNN